VGKTSGIGVTHGNVFKSQSQSLAPLSCVATTMSRVPTEDVKNQQQQQHQKYIRATTKSKASKTPITGRRLREKVGKLSRSLSRSRSTRNLQQNLSLSSHSSPLPALEQRESQLRQDLSRHKRSPSRSLPSLQRIAQTNLEASSNKSTPMIFQKYDEFPTSVSEKDALPDTGPSVGTEITSISTEIETTTVNLPPDGIYNEVYRSYEISLPISFPVGHVLTNTSNSHAQFLDTYNYDVLTNSPLQDPPRLPNAKESFVITERSKEEKRNWGWYV